MTGAPSRRAISDRSGERRFRKWVAPVAAVTIRLLSRTMSFRMKGQEFFEPVMTTDRPVIFAFWHEDLFGVATLHLRRNWRRPEGKRVAVMISQSRDGEKLAGVIVGLGLDPIRGSSSHGAVGGLIEFAHWLKEDKKRARFAALALDGPRGPRRVAKPGVALLARHTEALVLPVAFHISRQWAFGSWDRTKLAKPWAAMECRFGPMQDIRTWAGDDPSFARHLEQELNRLSDPIGGTGGWSAGAVA